MKGQLTEEQTHHLIDLGVAKEKATGKIPYLKGNITEYEYVFTLKNLFEILPAEIYDESGQLCWLKFEINKDICGAGYKQWESNQSLIYFNDKELINCLYLLMVWCINNNYLKS